MRKRLITAAAAVVTVGLIGGGAYAASAHTPDISCTPSGVVHIQLSSYPAGSTVTGTIGDAPVGPATFGPDTFTASEKVDLTVEHGYDITVIGSDGQGNEHWTGTTSVLCGVPVTPPVTEAPTPEPTPSTPVETPTPTPTPTPSTPVDVVEPRIQDYVTCKGAAFVLDNTASTVEVTYTVAGKQFVVPAGTAVHTDADGFLFPADIGVYKITTYPGDKTWAFAPPSDCAVVTPPVETPTPQPTGPATGAPTPTPTASTPVLVPVPTSPSGTTSVSTTTSPSSVTPEPSRTASPVAAASTSPGELAYTGTDRTTLTIGIVAFVLLVLAGTTILIRRRHRRV